MMNVIITIVSWVEIIPDDLRDEPWDSISDFAKRINIIFIHSLPLLFTTINMFLLSDMIVYFQDLWIVPVVAGAYLGFAWIYTI